jgi:hypothetical protein
MAGRTAESAEQEQGQALLALAREEVQSARPRVGWRQCPPDPGLSHQQGRDNRDTIAGIEAMIRTVANDDELYVPPYGPTLEMCRVLRKCI